EEIEAPPARALAWPNGTVPVLEDCPVAIARTEPCSGVSQRRAVRSMPPAKAMLSSMQTSFW
ncbi:hypothetical protein CN109_39055, partial [Sinorhizobium meliloti]